MLIPNPCSLYGGRGGGWHMGPGMMGGYGVMGILFWIVVVIGVVFLIRYLMRGGGKQDRNGSDKTALDILERRYAQGEIDREEYEAKRRDLSR